MTKAPSGVMIRNRRSSANEYTEQGFREKFRHVPEPFKPCKSCGARDVCECEAV